MFFSWWFLLFLASYGFSGAQSNYVAQDYRGSDNAADSYYLRAAEEPGPGLVSEGLDKTISLLSSVAGGLKSGLKNGYRNQKVADFADDIEKKTKDLDNYTSMMNKYIDKQKRYSADW